MSAHLSKKTSSTVAMMFAAAVLAAACSSSPNPAAPTPGAPTVSAVVVTGGSTSGISFQLTATARLTDQTTRDVTAAATWSSSNGALATVSPTGMVTVVGGGELDVRATYQNVTGSVHLLTATLPVATVTVSGPSASTSSFQLTATARLSDGTTQDVTQSATWLSSGPQWATVTSAGYVSIVSAGDVDLQATYKGVAGSLRVTVGLPRVFLVSGTVTDTGPSGQAIAGARVQVFAGMTDHVLSDARGLFSFRLPAGHAIIEVTKDGYQMWSGEIEIGGDMELAIVLVPTPPGATTSASETAQRGEAGWE